MGLVSTLAPLALIWKRGQTLKSFSQNRQEFSNELPKFWVAVDEKVFVLFFTIFRLFLPQFPPIKKEEKTLKTGKTIFLPEIAVGSTRLLVELHNKCFMLTRWTTPTTGLVSLYFTSRVYMLSFFVQLVSCMAIRWLELIKR